MSLPAYDRLRAAFRAFLEEFDPQRRFRTGYQYSVTSCDYAGQTADMDPVNASIGLPSLVAIPIRSPLLMVKLVSGDVVVVSFEDGNPAFPYVSGLPSGAGGVPVARQGDVVWAQAALVPLTAVGILPGTFGLTFSPADLGPPPSNAASMTPPPAASGKIYGIAATGSSFVKAK